MRQLSKITRIANFILFAEEDWVSFEEARSETDAKRMLGVDEVHKTEKGYGKGPAPKGETQNVQPYQNQAVVPRWMKDKDFVSKMAKERPDLNPEQIYEELKGYPDSKSRKLALHWTLTKGIVSPEEDKQKVLRAIKVSEMKKIDPMKYKSPLEITESFESEVKEDRINPDTVKEFSNKRELPEGVTYYDVEDSKEGQMAARRILDTHFGEDSNPWCLTYKDKGAKQPSDKAWSLWAGKYAGPKKIAFQNGKLIAFYGGSHWWDRFDNNSRGIPIISSLKNDKFGRKIIIEMDTDTGETGGTPTKVFKGDPNNGPYAEWHPKTVKNGEDGFLKMQCNHVKGKRVGLYKEYSGFTGKLIERFNYNKYGEPEGIKEKFYDTGEPHQTYQMSDAGDGRKMGPYKSFYVDGTIREQCIYNGDNPTERKVGPYILFHSNGKIKEKGEYDQKGHQTLVGTFIQFDGDGEETFRRRFIN